jgi:hypothetical protein
MFGTSPTVISKLIDRALPLLAENFKHFIPDKLEDEVPTSTLSKKIVAVVDSTIHATRRPARDQHVHYNTHYQRHGVLTHLLVDYDGNIVSVQTNVAGRIPDANAARNNATFLSILGQNRFALGDPGYAGVPWVVAGLKCNQVHTQEEAFFDMVSRSEQAKVEHVNSFIKKCKILSKSNQFHHNREKHIACVFIVCGWFNWMKQNFGKFE